MTCAAHLIPSRIRKLLHFSASHLEDRRRSELKTRNEVQSFTHRLGWVFCCLWILAERILLPDRHEERKRSSHFSLGKPHLLPHLDSLSAPLLFIRDIIKDFIMFLSYIIVGEYLMSGRTNLSSLSFLSFRIQDYLDLVLSSLMISFLRPPVLQPSMSSCVLHVLHREVEISLRLPHKIWNGWPDTTCMWNNHSLWNDFGKEQILFIICGSEF